MNKYILLNFVMIFALSCRTINTTLTDKSYINKKDSITKETILKTDTIYQTIYVQVKDSSANEKQSSTEIVFGNGGGTWNAATGEATNVKNVRTSETEKSLRLAVSNLESEVSNLHKELSEKSDSITELKQQNNVQTKHNEKARSSWYWWLIVGFCLGIGMVVALKKLPVTSWLMRWL